MAEHWSRQEIVKTIIMAMAEAGGKVKAVPAGKAADHILAYLAPLIEDAERWQGIAGQWQETATMLRDGPAPEGGEHARRCG